MFLVMLSLLTAFALICGGALAWVFFLLSGFQRGCQSRVERNYLPPSSGPTSLAVHFPICGASWRNSPR